ncbi:MAG: hypothetical protein M1453_10425 [Acidobacteria bacterium]|nr:hypothetical protein [Acidobacteriota bacterium]MCL5288393.1 hypothetical protein [Acidobacteriota bacterium]
MTTARKHNSRCEFLFADGRRCRQHPADPTLTLCLRHLQAREQQQATLRIGDEIVGPAGGLNTQEGIHAALCNVFANLARGRISPRSAAVLGYVGQLMLVSRPSLERSLKFDLAVAALAQKAAHQKAQSEAADADRLHKHALLELAITNGAIDLFKTFRAMTPDEGMRFTQFVRDFSGKDEKAPAPAASPASPFAAASHAASAAAAPKPTPHKEDAVPPPAKKSA